MNINLPYSDLPKIPVIDLREKETVPILEKEKRRLDNIFAMAKKHYGIYALTIGDFLSYRWLQRNKNPYLSEINCTQKFWPFPGGYLLNLSFEWSCTTGAGPDPKGLGNRLLRTLDWPLGGLGSNLVVVQRANLAGEYWDITWPGFIGVVTAVAPGRFSAAINQPPMRLWLSNYGIDWAINRGKVWFQKSLPPTHLLRKVFDVCRNYDEAQELLIKTPIAIPTFFTLSGVRPQESCVIERTEKQANVFEGSVACANHWMAGKERNWCRGIESHERQQAMKEIIGRDTNDFSWLKEPVYNNTTRVSVITNAATGTLFLQGWEHFGAATQILKLDRNTIDSVGSSEDEKP